MEQLANPEIWIALATLTALELVLGIDNIIFISILAGKLPPERRDKARRLGIMLAAVSRLGLLLAIAWIVGLTAPLFELFGHAFSWRDLILIGGGLFLIGKATHEIHQKLEGATEHVSTGGAAAAIAFAKAQLGEPYQWAAAGPNRWDCSGLTMMAWRAGGISLPHFSGAQYEQGTPISIGNARPGDLLFWSYNGRPSGIHHVALYLGDGSFIEAPHTGADVRYNTIYNEYPNFAVRL